MNIRDGWCLEAQKVISPNYNDRLDIDDVSLLVIHNISLPPNQFGAKYICDFFQNRLNPKGDSFFEKINDMKVSSHFLIDRIGNLIQFVSSNKRAWHAGESNFRGRENCNDFSIGIELEGTDFVRYTDIQYRVLINLTQALMVSYPLINESTIVGHNDIAPNRKTDPGAYFDWQRYLKGITKLF